MSVCVWRLAFGVWRLAFGVRRSAFGAVGGSHCRLRIYLGSSKTLLAGDLPYRNLEPNVLCIAERRTPNAER